ncbi:hypothetical protein HK099_008623 [Clydaea vesicula]|uniref:Vacuolar protein sorting-associated protein 51 homolog n=1 Tax=Clydaea vesicula TaxID=447962 RepID=A0AAD5U4S2_9FUNG|nr:hypothetical protein HK099_008623 [Clydaea vesicula]
MSEDLQPRKKRNLLKEYYGLKESTPQTEESATAFDSRRPDPLDLDIPAFNSELYLNKYLYEVGLSDLIRRDNDLVTEIKELDGDMKTLVYENYSKFISATDTIKKMKDNVENMEEKVQRLTATVDKISHGSHQINKQLFDKKNKIHQLSGVHQLLKKLNFVFELPNQLQKCLNSKDYDQAVRYYSKTRQLLNHYGHLHIFKKICDESQEIMKNVTKKVYENLNKEKATLQEVAVSINLLIGLDAKTANELADMFISLVEPKYILIINECKKIMKITNIKDFETEIEAKIDAADSSVFQIEKEENPEVKLIVSKLNYLNKNLIRNLCEFVNNFENFFISNHTIYSNMENSKRESNHSTENVTSNHDSLESLELQQTVIAPFARNISDHEKERNKALLFNFVENKLVSYFEIIEQLLQLPKYENVESEMEVVEQKNLIELVEELCLFIQDSLVKQSLPIFLNFSKNDNDSLEENDVAFQIKSGLKKFWLSLFQELEESFSVRSSKQNPIKALILSRLTLEFSNSVVEFTYNSFYQKIYGKNEAKNEENNIDLNVKPLQRRASNIKPSSNITKNLNINKFSKNEFSNIPVDNLFIIQGREVCLHAKIVAQIETDFENINIKQDYDIADLDPSLEEKEEELSPIWYDFYYTLKSLDKVLENIYPDDGTLKGKDGGKKIKNNSTSPKKNNKNMFNDNDQFDMLLSGIDRLFAEKVEYFTNIETTRGSILTCIIKISLKCLIEEIRSLTIFRYRINQKIKSDVNHLKQNIFKYSIDDKTLHFLLDEVITYSHSRTVII